MALPPELDLKDRDPLTKSKWDRAMNYLMAKFRTLDGHVPDWIEAVNQLRNVGLQRINEAIMPAFERVMNLATFGFLKGDSATAITVEIGRTLIITIDGDSQRELFTPTEFVSLTRASNPNDWAICRVLAYDAATGQLKLMVEAAEMSPGEHSDWQVTATAGTVTAAKALLTSTRAARDATEAIRQATTALREATAIDAAAAMKAAKDANTAALLIEGGPVASVNKRTGNIELGEGDIPGLTDKLEARAIKANVDDALATKVDKTDLTKGLSLKVDKTVFEQSTNTCSENLATKAEKLAVQTELENRYLKSEVDNRWNSKFGANGCYVYMPDGNSYLENKDAAFNMVVWGSHAFKLQNDGNIWTPMFGYLSNKFEWAREAAQGWAYGNLVQEVRLTGWWELGLGQGWTHCPNGGVCTSIHTNGSIAGQLPSHFGGRYMQILRGGNWYTIGVW